MKFSERKILSFPQSSSSIEKKRMQQSKILSFFKPSNPKSQIPPQASDHIDAWQLAGDADPKPLVTYNRRSSVSDPKRIDLEDDTSSREIEERSDRSANASPKSCSASKILNKKRSYAQYHLELGQSDFLLHACSVCGLMYARGDETDEKVHKAFHKDYYEGIQFKGWCNERMVCKPGSNRDHILLVLNYDPPAQKQKVNQVIRVMEKELGFSEDSLIHKLCKVYLFISSHRVVGCLVAEPIRTAHRVISSPLSSPSSDGRCSNAFSPKLEVASNDSKRMKPTTLQFGQFNFQREVAKRGRTVKNHRERERDICWSPSM
ncbi:protein CHROMOSOME TRANSMISSION FIDELITY 7-like isoform X1 [Iris pallida]|uniref:Protein CHROMOSOME TRANSMISSION FIDELITY 7-like isoform X1 n=1 Tax=Iris pallida TaxID=29817 RepID=A0AAX6FHB2_IRIPA|nr:protein CHROMOSOME TRANSMISSION FIDELITY 7-like isoform X1 [Iris pallida]